MPTSSIDTLLEYGYNGKPVTEHPNYEKALAWAKSMNVEHVWRGAWGQTPYLLDLDVECPKCGAGPWRHCVTPTHYRAKTHRARKLLVYGES